MVRFNADALNLKTCQVHIETMQSKCKMVVSLLWLKCIYIYTYMHETLKTLCWQMLERAKKV